MGNVTNKSSKVQDAFIFGFYITVVYSNIFFLLLLLKDSFCIICISSFFFFVCRSFSKWYAILSNLMQIFYFFRFIVWLEIRYALEADLLPVTVIENRQFYYFLIMLNVMHFVGFYLRRFFFPVKYNLFAQFNKVIKSKTKNIFTIFVAITLFYAY